MLISWFRVAAAAAAKSLQSCPTLRPHRWQPTRLPRPWDFPGKSTEVVAISFYNAWKWKVKVKSLSHVWLFTTPWTAAHQAPPSLGFSRQEDWSGCHRLLRCIHCFLITLYVLRSSQVFSLPTPVLSKPKSPPCSEFKMVCEWYTYLHVKCLPFFSSAASNIFGARVCFHGRQFFHGPRWGVWWFKLVTFMVLNFYCRHISPTSDHQAWLGTPALHHSQANLTHDSGSSCSSINLLYMMHMASPFAGPGSKGFRCDKPHLILTAKAWRVPSLLVFYIWVNRSVNQPSMCCWTAQLW